MDVSNVSPGLKRWLEETDQGSYRDLVPPREIVTVEVRVVPKRAEEPGRVLVGVGAWSGRCAPVATRILEAKESSSEGGLG